jgi:Family of unknown function (DUF6632)
MRGGPAEAKQSRWEEAMNNETRERYLKLALVVFGVVFLLIYPLSLLWPSGWVWHGGDGTYYLQMICGIYAVLGIFLIAAARNPAENRSLISFTIWSSVVHAAIMGTQALYDSREYGHLVGDVPALLLVAGLLWFLSPTNKAAIKEPG